MPRRAQCREHRAEVAGQVCTWQGPALAARASPDIPRGEGLLLGKAEAPTFLLHSCSEALLQPAVPALVPFVLVYHTLPVKPGKEGRKK